MLKITVLISAFILIIIISQFYSFNNNEQYSNLNLSDNIDRLTDNITNLADNIVDNVNEITDNGDDSPSYGEPRTRSGYPINDQIQQHEDNLKRHIENGQHHGHHGPDGPDVTPDKPIYKIKDCNKGKLCSADYVDVKGGLAPPQKTHAYANKTQCCVIDPRKTTKNNYKPCPTIAEEDQKALCGDNVITHGYPYLGGLNTNKCYDANSCWKSYTDDENLDNWVTAESDNTFRKYLNLSN